PVCLRDGREWRRRSYRKLQGLRHDARARSRARGAALRGDTPPRGHLRCVRAAVLRHTGRSHLRPAEDRGCRASGRPAGMGAIALRRLDRALADDPATAPRGELEPPFPHGCALALATHSPRRINVAVFVPDLAREFVKEFAHVRTTPRMACQLRSRYRRAPRDKGLGWDHQHRGGTAWPEILCTSRST